VTALAHVPVARIVGAIADAAERWADADFPARVRAQALIVQRTGYSLPVVEYALDQLFSTLRPAAIVATIERELGQLAVLDGYALQGGDVRARALPAGHACIVSSRTTIGVALWPALFALCAKCDVLVKDREDGFIRAFFATLAEELDKFAGAAHAQQWSGDDDAVDLQAFDAVVAFGNDATLARIAKQLSPSARYIAYGNKASAGYISAFALRDQRAAAAIAAGAARDLVLYDTEGCLSLHMLFIERGGAVTPEAFAPILAAEIERATVEFPLGTRDAGASAAVASARDLAAFRAAGGSGSIYSNPQASFVLLLDPSANEAPPMLPRTLAAYSVDGPDNAQAYVRTHGIPLEAIAVAGTTPAIACMAQTLGASRIARFGELQRPPLLAYHGGRPRIAEFVRWITDETHEGADDGR